MHHFKHTFAFLLLIIHLSTSINELRQDINSWVVSTNVGGAWTYEGTTRVLSQSYSDTQDAEIVLLDKQWDNAGVCVTITSTWAITFAGHDDWTASGLSLWNGKSASYCEWYFFYIKFDKNVHQLAVSRGNAPNDAESELKEVALQFAWVDGNDYVFAIEVCNGNEIEISIDGQSHMSYTDNGSKGKLYTTLDNGYSGFVGYWASRQLVTRVKSLSVSGTKHTVTPLVVSKPTNCVSLGPTRNPSKSPTPAPTDTPTEPTNVPSPSPTRHPSPAPTPRPTAGTTNPSVSPTPKPTPSTKDPSVSPTRYPSRKPTSDPSKGPTPAPSRLPTRSPTRNPSIDPTPSPSGRPSVPPTKRPSKDPTSPPTKQPSFSPSNVPSRHPIGGPTQSPTDHPTNHPSTPTISPTMHPIPPQSTSDSKDGSGSNRTEAEDEYAYLIVIAIGGVLAGAMICLIGALLYYLHRQKKRKQEKAKDASATKSDAMKRVKSVSSNRPIGTTVTLTHHSHHSHHSQKMLTHHSVVANQAQQVVLRHVSAPAAPDAQSPPIWGGPQLEQNDEGDSDNESDDNVLKQMDFMTAGRPMPHDDDMNMDIDIDMESDSDEEVIVKDITLGA